MKRNVPIGSEKMVEKLEDFLQRKGWCERLEPTELYAFRYALGSMKININNPSIIKRIGLNDIPSAFKSSKYIIFSENGKYGVKSEDDILDIRSNLDKRIIFFNFFSHEGDKIEQIYIYLPSKKDTTLFINNTTFSIDNAFIECKELIANYAGYDKFFKYHLQDEKILTPSELNYDKEFFSFTNLDIEGSTITFHYVP